MLPLSTFTKVPSFFLHGFKTPSKRNPWRAYINLVSTIWVLSYEEIKLKNKEIEIFYVHNPFDSETINFSNLSEKELEKLTKTDIKRIKADKVRILNFKIHSESEEGKWYFVSIGASEEIVKRDTPIAVYCSCPDFRYTFSYVLYKYKALLRDEEFPDIFKMVPPKHRNPYQIPWACKHVYTIANLIANYPEHFRFSKDFALKYIKKNIPSSRPKLSEILKFEKIMENLKKYFKKIKKMRLF